MFIFLILKVKCNEKRWIMFDNIKFDEQHLYFEVLCSLLVYNITHTLAKYKYKLWMRVLIALLLLLACFGVTPPARHPFIVSFDWHRSLPTMEHFISLILKINKLSGIMNFLSNFLVLTSLLNYSHKMKQKNFSYPQLMAIFYTLSIVYITNIPKKY